MHDATVDRTTNGSGNIATMTASQVKALNIKVDAYPEYQGKTLKVPTFEETMFLASKNDLLVNIDGSKMNWSDTSFTSKIVGIVKKYNMWSKAFFVIGNQTQRTDFMKIYPDARITWMNGSIAEVTNSLTQIKAYQNAFLSIPLSLATDSMILSIHSQTNYLQVYEVNTQIELNRLKGRGVNLIETDSLLP